MGYKSPAKIMRAVKRITKFLELKRQLLSKVPFPRLDIPPVQPVLSFTLCENANFLSKSQTSQQLSLFKTTFACCDHTIPSSTQPKLQPVEVKPLAVEALPHPYKRFDELTQRKFLAIIKTSFKPP